MSAIPFENCVCLLNAAVDIRDYKLHELIWQWMHFKWPNRATEYDSIVIPDLPDAVDASGAIVNVCSKSALKKAIIILWSIRYMYIE